MSQPVDTATPVTTTTAAWHVLEPGELAGALSIRDLTDPGQGPHALQLVVDAIVQALRAAWASDVRTVRTHPLVPVEENYERLGYPAGAITLDARYTRYASETCMLRSHTSAMIPGALRRLGAAADWTDVVLACPGVVYRRDVVDRLHTGTPHQVDLWRVVRGRKLGADDLVEMIELVVGAALPGAAYRTVPASHPYTGGGRQIDVLDGGDWVEIGECGYAAGHVLSAAGLHAAGVDAPVSGLAMGLGLDRLLMLRKGVPDIRLLSATDSRIQAQMLDLAPYRPVSNHPPISRDVSVAVAADADQETIGDAVRTALTDRVDAVEEVRIISETPVADLPPQAAVRLGARPGQKNVLVRVTLRDPARTLTDAEANVLRDQIYAALHQGRAAPH